MSRSFISSTSRVRYASWSRRQRCSFEYVASLTDNFLLDPLLRQPFLSAEREDSHDKLVTPVAICPSELHVSPFRLIVVLGLVESKGHRSLLVVFLRGVRRINAERPR